MDIIAGFLGLLELEKKIEGLVSEIKEKIDAEADKKKREALASALQARDLEAFRKAYWGDLYLPAVPEEPEQ